MASKSLGSIVKQQDEIVNKLKAIASKPIPKSGIESQDPNDDYDQGEYVFENFQRRYQCHGFYHSEPIAVEGNIYTMIMKPLGYSTGANTHISIQVERTHL